MYVYLALDFNGILRGIFSTKEKAIDNMKEGFPNCTVEAEIDEGVWQYADVMVGSKDVGQVCKTKLDDSHNPIGV